MRATIFLSVLLCMFGCQHTLALPRGSYAIAFRGVKALPAEVVVGKDHFPLEGLSGITYIGDDRYLAVLDNSSRVATLHVETKPDGSISKATCESMLVLDAKHDNEGIALSADGKSIYISEENTPAIRQYDRSSGRELACIMPPAIFTQSGGVDNFGFESLTRSGDSLWTANEEALPGDGPRSTAEHGTRVRMLQLDAATSKPRAQYVYDVDAIGGEKIEMWKAGNPSRAGVSDIVSLPDGSLLVLERALNYRGRIGSFFAIRLNRVIPETSTALSTTQAAASIVGDDVPVLVKEALYSTRGLIIQNLEGLCLGPQLDTNRWLMLGVIDNNGGPFASQLVAFELTLNLPTTQPGQPKNR